MGVAAGTLLHPSIRLHLLLLAGLTPFISNFTLAVIFFFFQNVVILRYWPGARSDPAQPTLIHARPFGAGQSAQPAFTLSLGMLSRGRPCPKLPRSVSTAELDASAAAPGPSHCHIAGASCGPSALFSWLYTVRAQVMRVGRAIDATPAPNPNSYGVPCKVQYRVDAPWDLGI